MKRQSAKTIWPAFRLPYDVERGTANPLNRRSRIGYRWHAAYSVAHSDGSQLQAMRICEIRDLAARDGAVVRVFPSEKAAFDYWKT